MGLGLGHLMDLNRKLQNNKNLLSAKSAKTRLINRARNINIREKGNSKKVTNISEKELNQIKINIRKNIQKERNKEYLFTGIGIIIFIGIALIFWLLLQKNSMKNILKNFESKNFEQQRIN